MSAGTPIPPHLARRGQSQGGVRGWKTEGANVKEAGPAEPRGRGWTERVDVAAPPEGAWPGRLLGGGVRLPAPGTSLRESSSKRQCRVPHLL